MRVVDTAVPVAVKMGNAPSGKTDVGELRRPARRERGEFCLCAIGKGSACVQ